jgi:hypothetical protein
MCKVTKVAWLGWFAVSRKASEGYSDVKACS